MREAEVMENKRYKLLTIIVNRGKGDKVVAVLNQKEIMFNLIILGEGTADSDVLDYLGIGEVDKDVVLSIVAEEKLEEVLKDLREKMQFNLPGKGIAFTVPLSSIAARMLKHM